MTFSIEIHDTKVCMIKLHALLHYANTRIRHKNYTIADTIKTMILGRGMMMSSIL